MSRSGSTPNDVRLPIGRAGSYGGPVATRENLAQYATLTRRSYVDFGYLASAACRA